MRRFYVSIAATSIVALVISGIAIASSGDGIRRDVVLRFLDVSGDVEYLDLGEPAQGEFDPSPGDTFFFNNTLRNAANTRTVGRFPSKCVALFGTEFKCSGTLLLGEGTIELSATVDFAAEDPIRSAVTGGTRGFRNVGGDATITPTEVEGTSELVVKLVAIRGASGAP
jgi:hypothetical protein